MRSKINQAREGEDRGKGIPRSEDERQERHESLYPGTPLPPRGTGLISSLTGTDFAVLLVAASLSGIMVGVTLDAIKKSKK